MKKIISFFYWGWKMRNFQGWDYGYFVEALTTIFAYMENTFRQHQITTQCEETADQLKECKELCWRLADKHPEQLEKQLDLKTTTDWIKYFKEEQPNDWEQKYIDQLCENIKSNMRKWWN